MIIPRRSVQSFLNDAKASLVRALRGVGKVKIVLGNESADLDSLTSSLLYAYIKSCVLSSNDDAAAYIPMLNIQHPAIRLRPEFHVVCNQIGISTLDLLSLSDLAPKMLCPANISWILVDHNKSEGALEQVQAEMICGVIDHHDEENALSWSMEPRIVRKAASCTSLVVQHCRSSWDEMSRTMLPAHAHLTEGRSLVENIAVKQEWDSELAQFALASILIDTANMTAIQLIEDIDKHAVDYLEAKIEASKSPLKMWDRQRFYTSLETVKNKLDSLSVEEILIKDFKAWGPDERRLGISSVVQPVEFLVEHCVRSATHSSLADVLTAFAKEQDLAMFAVMTNFKDQAGQYRRELLLECRSTIALMGEEFFAESRDRLGLTPLRWSSHDVDKMDGLDQGVWRKSWAQNNVFESRKGLAPMLRKAMKIE